MIQNSNLPRELISPTVLLLADIDWSDVSNLLSRFDLELVRIPNNATIPGSYWGEPEAGIIGSTVYAREDTPVHSVLHEAGHLMVLPAEARQHVHTDATDSQAEEDAVCYLQIVLADALPCVGRVRMMQDMNRWGYTFRLGSAQAWFQHDAEDAKSWLDTQRLLPTRSTPCLPRHI